MMNILVTLDRGYVYPLCAMLRSLADSNRDDCITVYVAHSALTEYDFRQMRFSVYGSDIRLVSLKVDPSLFENAPTKHRITKETYYRLLAPAYLPKNVDRILYIDPDTVILNPISEFYFTDFDGDMIIAAKHFDGITDRWNKFRLSLEKSEHYINAGVMLMDINAMRSYITPQGVFDCVRKNRSRLFLADQDAVNIIYDGKIGTLEEKLINFDERCFRRLLKNMSEEEALGEVRRNTVIVHFDGKYKPWKPDYKGSMKCFFDMYSSPNTKRRRFDLDEGA